MQHLSRLLPYNPLKSSLAATNLRSTFRLFSSGSDVDRSWSTGLTKEHFDSRLIDPEQQSQTQSQEAENKKGKAFVNGWGERLREMSVLLKQVREPGAHLKGEMYKLHKENPEVYTVDKLAKDYRIMRHAILWLKELEEEEEKKLGDPLDHSVELLLDTKNFQGQDLD